MHRPTYALHPEGLHPARGLTFDHILSLLLLHSFSFGVLKQPWRQTYADYHMQEETSYTMFNFQFFKLSCCSFHLYIAGRAHCKTYRVMHFPIGAGCIEDMVAGLIFHLPLGAERVRINNLVRKQCQLKQIQYHLWQVITICCQFHGP